MAEKIEFMHCSNCGNFFWGTDNVHLTEVECPECLSMVDDGNIEVITKEEYVEGTVGKHIVFNPKNLSEFLRWAYCLSYFDFCEIMGKPNDDQWCLEKFPSAGRNIQKFYCNLDSANQKRFFNGWVASKEVK